MKSSQQIFQELNLCPKICKEKIEKTEISSSDEITQTILANIQSLVSVLAILTAALVKK